MDDSTATNKPDLTTPDQPDDTTARIRPVLDVIGLLRDGTIRVAFQRIIDLGTDDVIGYEALARFPGEVVSPGPWFAEAKVQGLDKELEVAAVKAALACLDRLPAEVFLAVNVSPLTAASPALFELLVSVEAARVVLEIKEGEAIEAYPQFSTAFDELRSSGVRIAVDDAGMADVSLRHMLDVRPDIIKIDVDVTRGIEHDPIKQTIAATFGSLAARAGALSLAEGVETKDELAMLRTLGIAAGQGYLFGRPEYLPA
jgi:EAL domain-containing protein (putative c-di-GMP-specific phosphodiesterase class I)